MDVVGQATRRFFMCRCAGGRGLLAVVAKVDVYDELVVLFAFLWSLLVFQTELLFQDPADCSVGAVHACVRPWLRDRHLLLVVRRCLPLSRLTAVEAERALLQILLSFLQLLLKRLNPCLFLL